MDGDATINFTSGSQPFCMHAHVHKHSKTLVRSVTREQHATSQIDRMCRYIAYCYCYNGYYGYYAGHRLPLPPAQLFALGCTMEPRPSAPRRGASLRFLPQTAHNVPSHYIIHKRDHNVLRKKRHAGRRPEARVHSAAECQHLVLLHSKVVQNCRVVPPTCR